MKEVTWWGKRQTDTLTACQRARLFWEWAHGWEKRVCVWYRKQAHTLTSCRAMFGSWEITLCSIFPGRRRHTQVWAWVESGVYTLLRHLYCQKITPAFKNGCGDNWCVCMLKTDYQRAIQWYDRCVCGAVRCNLCDCTANTCRRCGV